MSESGPKKQDARGKLLGWETHNIHFPEDLPSQKVKESAVKGFLSDEQYFAILLNPSHYSELITGDGGPDSFSSVLQVQVDRRGVILLCKEDVVPDKIGWSHKSVRVAKFQGMAVMKVTACYNKHEEKWECQLMSRSMGFKIVHYHKTIDESHKNRASVQLKLSDMQNKVHNLTSGSGGKK